ncbi:MAG: alpha-amylase family glycosyl hydrolase [Chitinophagaceae bacterium]
MKKILSFLAVAGLISVSVQAQLLTWAPGFAKDNDNITIVVDATRGNQGLNNYASVNDVYIHVGVITNLSTSQTNWRYAPFTWGSTNSAAQATSLGGNKWQFTINNIRSFFGVPAGETILKIAILFRNGSGSLVQRNADGSDMFITVYDNSLATRFSEPFFQPTYTPVPEPIIKSQGDNISLVAIANQSAAMKLFLNGNEIQSATNVTTISANPVLSVAGNQQVRVETTVGATTRSESFQFFVASPVNIAALPPGVRDGINYETGNTSVVLVLYAPGKNRVSVIGEFPGSNWAEQTNYQMNKTPDGNYWWLRITGLTPGTEYAFQYLVDGTLKTGDPYAEKVLDPFNDGSINATTYPGLRAYPTGQTTGIVSLVQTAAPGYNWNSNSYIRPDKRNLVIYELLLRDFLQAHDWKTLRDTLSYLKRLGVNAIQVMPFNEFDGNESWGYNPSYFLAPDKYYGPKNMLKEFVDSCHANGIAVLMDIALNHTTGSNPLAALYWNSSSNQPAANNPWLNVSARHPYNVFNDFNHESLQTRYFTSRVIEHWLQEYRLDGFRWDLSKGFTQNTQCSGSTSNESCFAAYHADRVAIWKRYYDTMQLKSPGSICILEHFADNSEEIELSDYGLMLWGNLNYNFTEASMGWVANSNFEGYLHSARSWSKPHLVGYMESHDEERMMYKNLQFGNNSNGAHNVRDLSVALKRVELCAAFFLAAPGPKMIWQFGELGYDFSINRCVDGTVNNNCRLDNKPIRWDYQTVTARKRVYDIFSAMNKLRFHPWYKDVFIANNTTITRNLSAAFKSLTVRSATDSSMVCVIGNFDVTAQTSTFAFPAGGTWYDYLGGGTFSATGGSQGITLQPGEVHVYLNRNLVNAVVTSTGGVPAGTDRVGARFYPNPATAGSWLELSIPKTGATDIRVYNAVGQEMSIIFSGNLVKGIHRMAIAGKINNLPAGSYWMRITTSGQTVPVSFLVQ